jgi:hypothetical protein
MIAAFPSALNQEPSPSRANRATCKALTFYQELMVRNVLPIAIRYAVIVGLLRLSRCIAELV